MIVKPLPWDSEFFGVAAGSLVIHPTVLPDDVSRILNSCDCDVVYIQVVNPTPDQLDRFSKLAPLVDHKVVYEKAVSEDVVVVKKQMRPYEGGITDGLVEMAWASGTHSRFYLDPHFHPHYRRLYRTWLVKSLASDLADVVFVHNVRGVQVGFVSAAAKGSMGQIGLIAVAGDYRRQGIADNLLRNVNAWCRQSNLKRVRVVTQKANTAACRLYEKHCYQVAETIGIYHFWKP